MAYYLGRDVSVTLKTESSSDGMDIDGDVSGSTAGTFATGGGIAGTAVTDLTGVDIGIGVQDEDISYVGGMNVLKTEIKKETTVSLTRKKSGILWDIVFNGPCKSGEELISGTVNHGARWGLADNTSASVKISNGLISPKDSNNGTNVTFGYRIFIQLKSAVEVFTVPACQITGHTVSLNADGTTEETMEFSSNVTPFLGAAVDLTRLVSSDI